MSFVSNSRMAFIGGLGLCMALAFCSRTAQASSHWDVGVGLGFAQPAPAYGHYETRVERVLVSPEHYERRWVDAVYETRISHGYSTTFMIRSGYWTEVVVPARFEDRYVKVWVSCPPPAPTITSGFLGLEFGRSRR